MEFKVDQSGLGVVAKAGQQLFNFITFETHDFMGIRPTGILGKFLF